MARSKSNAGGKTNRSSENENKEQNAVANLTNRDQRVAETAAELKATREPSVTAEPKIVSEPKVATETKFASDGRKLEVMKTDSRKNVVPINLEDEIRRRAFEIYQQRGSGSGSESQDWLTAEYEVRQRYRQQSA